MNLFSRIVITMVLAVLSSHYAIAYHNISPYAWCGGNPVKFVDPDGQKYLVTDLGAQQAILNTLSKTDAPYVQFYDNGYLNRNLLLSHHSSSNNYNIICEIEQALEIVTVEMNDKFRYKDNNNVIQDSDVMSYSIDEDFIDNEVTGAYSNTTGEMGSLGIALLPGKGKSNVNSIDENIHVILNKNLSKEGAAANISHEVNGHVLMYLRTHDRQLSGHDYDGNREKNRHLYEMIFNSLIETITNLRTNE